MYTSFRLYTFVKILYGLRAVIAGLLGAAYLVLKILHRGAMSKSLRDPAYDAEERRYFWLAMAVLFLLVVMVGTSALCGPPPTHTVVPP